MIRITFKKLLLTTIIAITTVITITSISATQVYAEDCGGFFCTTFVDGSMAVATSSGGNILGGFEEFYVEHPFYVSSRPANEKSGDPNDPTLIEGAYLKNTWTGLKDNLGNPIPGASIEQYWVGVTSDEAVDLWNNGYALTGSSGGFSFKLVKQIASPEAEEAFGAVSIDNTETGEPLLLANTAWGFCG